MKMVSPLRKCVSLGVTLLVVLSQIVCGSACQGDGSVTDTCPDGEYCKGGICHNCSLCSVDSLVQGFALTKCLCVPSSSRICVSVPSDSEKQLVEHPSQLSFTNWTGYENTDLTYLRESYNRSAIDCTVPTTSKGPTSPSNMATTLAITLPSKTSEKPTLSTQGAATTKAASPTSVNLVSIILAVVVVAMAITIILLIIWICLHRGKCKCLIACLTKKKESEIDPEAGRGQGRGDQNAQTQGTNTQGSSTIATDDNVGGGDGPRERIELKTQGSDTIATDDNVGGGEVIGGEGPSEITPMISSD